MKDKFRSIFSKKGVPYRVDLEVNLIQVAASMQYESFRISCAPGLFISSAAYPKGITFPLGSCLSRTNSRNSSRRYCPWRSFPEVDQPYQGLDSYPSPFFDLSFFTSSSFKRISENTLALWGILEAAFKAPLHFFRGRGEVVTVLNLESAELGSALGEQKLRRRFLKARYF